MRRVVAKIGTSVLLDADGKISSSRAENFARQIKAVRDRSVDVIVVSSGAQACGMERVGIRRKPREMARKQALHWPGHTHAHVHGRIRQSGADGEPDTPHP